MQSKTKTQLTYWSLTLLFCVPLAFSGAALIIGVPKMVGPITQLGYPLYLMRFLGTAKILGVLAIVTGKSPRLKEWAYAGFTFNLLGAAYSHLAAGEPSHMAQPLIMLAFVLISYAQWPKIKDEKIVSRT